MTALREATNTASNHIVEDSEDEEQQTDAFFSQLKDLNVGKKQRSRSIFMNRNNQQNSHGAANVSILNIVEAKDYYRKYDDKANPNN